MSSKSLRSRMGAAVRRSSTILSLGSRPTTPSRRSSSESLRSTSRLDTNLSPPPEAETRKVVSPIAESPMNAVPPTNPEEDPKPTQEGPSQPEPVEPATTGPKPEEPAPVIENDTNATSKPEQASVHGPETVGPEHLQAHEPVGMFTDEPEAMSIRSKDNKSVKSAVMDGPQSAVPIDEEHMSPSGPSNMAPAPGAFTDSLMVDLPPVVVAQEPTYQMSPAVEEPRAPSPVPVVKVEDSPTILPATPPTIPTVMPATPPREPEDLPAVAPGPVQASPRSISYVNLPQSHEPAPITQTQDAFRHSIEENVWGARPEPVEEREPPHVDATRSLNGMPMIPDPAENGHAHTKMPEPVSLPHPQHHQALDDGYNPVPVWKNVSAKSSTESFRHDEGRHKLEAQRHIAVEHSEGITLYDDPFADPTPVPPVVTVQSAEVPTMPQPEAHNGHAYKIRSTPSAQSLNQPPQEINERMPLLAHSMTPQLSTYSYLNNNNVPAVSVDTSISSAQQLHLLGWIEYALPDGTRYYVHPTLRVTTDVDLRDARLLQAVSDHLELGVDYQGGKYELHKDYELWLRNMTTHGEVQLSRYWVNHGKKRVSLTAPHVAEEHGGPSSQEADDHLDMEYRYWAYMESHPAHISLPQNATSEAMEALTWSYTDQLLPSDRQDPPPFSPSECQELMNLLRSFGDSSNARGPSPVKARVVSRIHIRAAQWRQAHFRPDKPLPQDVPFNHGSHLNRRSTWGKALADVFISCLCFGIPYLLFHRSHRRIDEESGIFRPPQSGPVLVVGACTCLVAAVVLSASVTFLSLPGMDHFARIAAVVSILFSASSMVSSVVALFRYKAEVDRAMVITQALIGEGMMYEYRRSVIISLPLVFLVYAIIGFIAGIILYSFRSAEVSGPLFLIRHFDDYTRWIVIGFFGGLAGIVTTLALAGQQ